jgi:hypothetical protein
MRISRPKRGEVMGGWRKLRYEELHNLYSSQNIISVMKSRMMRWMGHVACMGEISAYKILVGKPEGKKRPHGRPRQRRKDNIKMDLRETGFGGTD